MEDITDLVLQTTLDSAKKKFDYALFEKDFVKLDKELAEIILAKIILGFASEENEELIAEKLFNTILPYQMIWEKTEILGFVAEKKKLFASEIFATKIVSSMLQEGAEPAAILNSLNQLL